MKSIAGHFLLLTLPLWSLSPTSSLAQTTDVTPTINGCELRPQTDCRTVGAGLKYANLRGQDLTGANFAGLTLHGASLREANLQDADLQGAEFDMADLSGADLRGANLTGAYLSLSVLTAVDLRGANLTQVDLSRAQGGRTVQWEGAILCETVLPDGSQRDDHCPDP